MAISIDYFGDNSKAPTAEAVLGTALEPKADGSMYQLNRLSRRRVLGVLQPDRRRQTDRHDNMQKM